MRSRFALLCSLMLSATVAFACTSAVISGRATRDGRPILWKQRDTGVFENKLVHGTGGTYRYIGVHDQTDVNNEECFMGWSFER